MKAQKKLSVTLLDGFRREIKEMSNNMQTIRHNKITVDMRVKTHYLLSVFRPSSLSHQVIET